jgi:single-strand DNA-binding protein
VNVDLAALCAAAVVDPTVVLDPGVFGQLGKIVAVVACDGEPWPIDVEDPRRPDGRMEVVRVFSPLRPLPYPGPDVVAATIQSRRTPTMLRTSSVVASGRQEVGARGLRDTLPVLPDLVLHVNDDPVLWLVRHRRHARAAGDAAVAAELHAVVNSLVSGNPSRVDELRRRAGRGWEPIERFGPWAFLPIAATVTAGTRLLLAVLDRMVRDRGGLVIYRDTDSSLILSSPDGGELVVADGSVVRLLSWAEVDEIMAKFAPLSPDPGWPVWKVERGTPDQPLHALVFGPKRHTEFTVDSNGVPTIAHATEANLGRRFADPPALRGRAGGTRRWSRVAVDREVRFALAKSRNSRHWRREPAAWDAGQRLPFPALRRLVVTTPEVLASLPAALGARLGTRYLEGVLDRVLRTNGGGSPVALDPGGDLADWSNLRWVDRRTGERIHATTDPADVDAVLLDTLARRGAAWSARSSIEPIDEVTVDPALVRHVGSASAVIDAELDGIPGTLSSRRTVYDEADQLAAVHRWAATLGSRSFARLTGLPITVARRAATGRPISPTNLAKAIAALGLADTATACAADGCHNPVVRAGARYCSPRCQDRQKKRRRRRPPDHNPSPSSPAPRDRESGRGAVGTNLHQPRHKEVQRTMPAAKTTTPNPDASRLPALVSKVGNLTRDPELRHGKESGTPFVSVSLAVNTPKTPGDWAGEQETTFYDVTAFGSLAEHAATCLTKGIRVLVIGRPEVERYTAEDGTERERKRIIADALGPDLRWATVKIARATQRTEVAAPTVSDDEEPF